MATASASAAATLDAPAWTRRIAIPPVPDDLCGRLRFDGHRRELWQRYIEVVAHRLDEAGITPTARRIAEVIDTGHTEESIAGTIGTLHRAGRWPWSMAPAHGAAARPPLPDPRQVNLSDGTARVLGTALSLIREGHYPTLAAIGARLRLAPNTIHSYRATLLARGLWPCLHHSREAVRETSIQDMARAVELRAWLTRYRDDARLHPRVSRATPLARPNAEAAALLALIRARRADQQSRHETAPPAWHAQPPAVFDPGKPYRLPSPQRMAAELCSGSAAGGENEAE